MEFVIEQQQEKPLVERTEVKIRIKDTNATPSAAQVREAAAKLLDKPAELIKVKHIHQRFGAREALALVYCYQSEAALKKFEPREKPKPELPEAAKAAKS